MTDNQKIEKAIWFHLRWRLEIGLPLTVYFFVVWRVVHLHLNVDVKSFSIYFFCIWILGSACTVYAIAKFLWLLRLLRNNKLSGKQIQYLMELYAWHTLLLHEKTDDPILNFLYNFFGKVFQQFFLVIRFLWKNPFCFFTFTLFFIVGLLGFLFPHFLFPLPPPTGNQGFWQWFLTLWFGSFLMFSCFFAGYLLIGEFLQRRLLTTKRRWIYELIVGYIWSIPLIIIVSSFWLLFILSSIIKSKKGKTELPEDLEILSPKRFFFNLSFFILFKTFQYYTYVNLAMIALEDRALAYSIRHSSEFLRNHALPLSSIWKCNIILFVTPVSFWFLIVSPFWEFFHLDFLLGQETFMRIGVYLGLLMLVYLPFGLLAEQVCVLLYYLKATRPEADFGRIGFASEEVEKISHADYL